MPARSVRLLAQRSQAAYRVICVICVIRVIRAAGACVSPSSLAEGKEGSLAWSAWPDWPHSTPRDFAGAWSWLAAVAGQAIEGGAGGMVDDDLAYVAPWGFDPGQVSPPVLFLHGGQDRIVPSSHGKWLARHTRSAELRLRPDDGHISVLNSGATAMDWLREHANQG